MELGWLKYFYEVAKTQSVTRASQKLRVSQPAVSKMIKQLEGSLGYPLFQKSGREIRLTADGQQLLQVCHPIFDRISEISRLKASVDFESDEVIRMGASDNLCNYILPQCIHKFRVRFPKMQWNLYSGSSPEIKSKILSGDLDAGIFYTRLNFKDKQLLTEQVIGKVKFLVVYPSHFGKLSSIAAFNKAKMTYIGARMNEYQQTNPEQWIYHRLKLNIENSFQINSKETQKRMVLQGLGYAILPQLMPIKEMLAGKLLDLKAAEESADVVLVTRKQESLSLNTDYFIKHFFKIQ